MDRETTESARGRAALALSRSSGTLSTAATHRATTAAMRERLDRQAHRGLWSALLTLRVGDWADEGFVNNLTNQVYISGSAGNAEFYGAPREYGVRTSVRF